MDLIVWGTRNTTSSALSSFSPDFSSALLDRSIGSEFMAWSWRIFVREDCYLPENRGEHVWDGNKGSQGLYIRCREGQVRRASLSLYESAPSPSIHPLTLLHSLLTFMLLWFLCDVFYVCLYFHSMSTNLILIVPRTSQPEMDLREGLPSLEIQTAIHSRWKWRGPLP